MCMQTFSCVHTSINKCKFILKKLLQGIICGFFSLLYVYFSKLEPTESTILSFEDQIFVGNAVISAIFIFCVIISLKKELKNIDFS